MKTFDEFYDDLDPSNRGYITGQEIKLFFDLLHNCNVDKTHVNRSIDYVTKSTNGTVRKHQFPAVITELDRRRRLEEKSRWDFQALDRFGTNRLSVADALLLFRLAHGDNFQLDFWHRFIESRNDQLATTKAVTFHEIRYWLCEHPTTTTSNTNDQTESIDDEIASLNEDYETYVQNQIDLLLEQTDEERMMERDMNEKRTTRLSRRKLLRWETEGVDGLLDDDGLDDLSEPMIITQKRSSTSLLLSLIELKYQLLRDRLINLMAEGNMGSAVWLASTNAQRLTILRKIQTTEKQLRRTNQLESSNTIIPGSQILISNLEILLGDLKKENDKQQQQQQLDQTPKTKNQIEQFTNAINMLTNCGRNLVLLENRRSRERSLALSLIGQPAEQLKEYETRLIRQIIVLKEYQHPEICSLMVGLYERPQILYQFENQTEIDHLRHERLVKLIIEYEAIPETVDMEDNRLLLYVAKRHFVERQQLTKIVDQLPIKIETVPEIEERTKILWQLRNDWQTWREAGEEYRKTNRNNTIEIIFQRAAQLLIGSADTKVADQQQQQQTQILRLYAKLQAQQHIEFDRLIKQIKSGIKVVKTMKNLEIEQESKLKMNDCDNLATILLDIIDVSDDERPYVSSLEVKYAALKDVALKQALRSQYAANWYRLTIEEQQNLKSQMVKSETKARKQADPKAFESILGRFGSKLKSVNYYMGSIRSTTMINREHNFLYDLTTRFRMEQQNVLNTLRKYGNDEMLLVAIRHESWLALKEEETEISAIHVGLAERSYSQENDADDRHRHELLAKLRSDCRRKRIQESAQDSILIEEDSTPRKTIDTDINEWRRSLLVEVSKKHRQEIEYLLYILQDSSLDELVEETNRMSIMDIKRRLNQLYFTRKTNENNTTIDDRLSLIEEASSLRLSLKHHQANNKDLSIDDLIVSLIADVQEAQDSETKYVYKSLNNLDMNQIKYKRGREIDSRHGTELHNVLDVLTKYEGPLSDDGLIAALKERQNQLEKLLPAQTSHDERIGLKSNFDEELQRLMDSLRVINERFMDERQRQAFLLKIQREKRLLDNQNDFQTALILLQQSSDYEKCLNDKMKDEKNRLLELARQHLNTIRINKQTPIKVDDRTQPSDNNPETIKESILKLADQQFDIERRLLVELYGTLKTDKSTEKLSNEQRNIKLDEIRNNLRNIEPENFPSRCQLIQESINLQKQNRISNRQLSKDKDGDNDILLSFLVDLETLQKIEINNLINTLSNDIDNQQIDQQQTKYLRNIRYKITPNLEQLLFNIDKCIDDTAIINALRNKYDAVNETISETNTTKRTSILNDLKKDFDKEKKKLLNDLNNVNDKITAERKRQMELVRLRHEERQLRRNQSNETVGLLLAGLANVEGKTSDARKRQLELAKAKLEARRLRKNGTNEKDHYDDHDHGVITADQHDALLRNTERKHDLEQAYLMDIFDSIDTEKQSEINESEFNDLMLILTNNYQERKDEHIDDINIILKKAAALHFRQNKNTDELKATLLANLQHLQDAELKNLIAQESEISKNENLLKNMLLVQEQETQRKTLIAAVLLNITPQSTTIRTDDPSEEDIVKELDLKYESIRKKILTKTAIKEINGKDRWISLNYKEQMVRLMKLQRLENKMRREGKLNVANKLFDLSDIIMGETKNEVLERNEQRLKRKKELIQERRNDGLSTNDAIIETVLDQEEEKVGKSKEKNVLQRLQEHYEEEKSALLSKLKDASSRSNNDVKKESQITYARLKADKHILQNETDLNIAIATLLRQKDNFQQQQQLPVTVQRQRERQLAEQRLLNLTAGHKEEQLQNINKKEILNDLENDEILHNQYKNQISYQMKTNNDGGSGGKPPMHLLLDRMKISHEKERRLFAKIFNSATITEADFIKSLMSKQIPEIRQDLEKIQKQQIDMKNKIEHLPENLTDSEKEIIAEAQLKQFQDMKHALIMKLTTEYSNLSKSEANTEKVQKEIAIALLADLENHQQAEQTAIMETLKNMDGESLLRLLEHKRATEAKGQFENLNNLLFNVKAINSNEVGLTAEQKQTSNKELDDEYDKLKERLKEKQLLEADYEAELNRIDEEYKKAKIALQNTFDRQKQSAIDKIDSRLTEKLLQKRQEDATAEFLKAAKLQEQHVTNVMNSQQQRQSLKMKQRLEERKASRKETQNKLRNIESSSKENRDNENLLSPPLSLQREGTVLPVNFSGTSAEEEYRRLKLDVESYEARIEGERRRQQRMLEDRKRRRHSLTEAEALDVMSKAEEHRLQVEKSLDDERQRQLYAAMEKVRRNSRGKTSDEDVKGILERMKERKQGRSESKQQ